MHTHIDRLCQAAKREQACRNPEAPSPPAATDMERKKLPLTSLTLEFSRVESFFHSRGDRSPSTFVERIDASARSPGESALFRPHHSSPDVCHRRTRRLSPSSPLHG